MKIAGWFVGIVLAAVLMFIAAERIASETAEVVILHTDDGAEQVTTRLWVADYDGSAWLRTGADGSGWYTRLTANPQIEVERDGRLASYTAVPEPSASDAVNARMLEKYGWRDRFIGMIVGGREGSIAIRLVPRD
jgi:hypothetical protein